MKKIKQILLALLLTISFATSLAQVQNGGLATENGSKFFFSSINSSTAQLAASATFTGTIESITNQRSYSLLFFSDQNATITVNQFIDAGGTKNAQQLVFTYTANSKFARSGALNGNYIQVIVQNTGGSTTTTLQLDMAYGNIDAATVLNNLPTAIMEVNGTAVDQNSGSKSNGSQRVVIATDDINIAAINTATAAINTKITQGQAAASSSQSVTLSNENVQWLYFTGQSAQTATVNNIIPSTVSSNATDATGFNSALVQIICPAGTYTTGAIIFEGTNDGSATTNFQTIPVWNQAIATGTPITAAITLVTTTSIGYTFPIKFRYIRVRISTAVSGASASVQAVTTFSQSAWTPNYFQVSQATAANLNVTATQTGTWTTQVGNTANTTPILANVLIPVGTTTGDTGAKTTTGNGATLTNVNAKGVQCVVNMGAVTGTTPTATIKLQGSSDAGTTWVDIPGATTASLTATGVYGITVYPGVAAVAGTTTTGTTAMVSAIIPRTWRIVWTIGGTTPSFTITNVQIAYIF